MADGAFRLHRHVVSRDTKITSFVRAKPMIGKEGKEGREKSRAGKEICKSANGRRSDKFISAKDYRLSSSFS